VAPLDFALLKERYDFELARKEHLTNALTMPIGVVSGVAGLFAGMARSFSYPDSWLWWVFVPLIVVGMFAFVACLWFLASAYHLQTYEYRPLLRALEESEEEFRDFASYVEGSGGTLIEDFQEDFRRGMIRAADANTRTNEKRAEYLRVGRLWLFAVLWVTFIAGFPWVADQVLKVK
jgi:hypothetical protein